MGHNVKDARLPRPLRSMNDELAIRAALSVCMKDSLLNAALGAGHFRISSTGQVVSLA